MFLSQITHFHWFPRQNPSFLRSAPRATWTLLVSLGLAAGIAGNIENTWGMLANLWPNQTKATIFSYFFEIPKHADYFGVGNWFSICCFEPRYALKTTRLLKDEVRCFLQMLALAAHVWLIWNMLFIDICEFFDSTSMYILSLDRSAEQEIRQLLFLAPIEVMILGESNIFSMILTCSVCRKTARENLGCL